MPSSDALSWRTAALASSRSSPRALRARSFPWVSDAEIGNPCVGRYTRPETVSEAVLAVGVVEAIIMANDPARLPWEVEAEVYSTALLWFAEPREEGMLEWAATR